MNREHGAGHVVTGAASLVGLHLRLERPNDHGCSRCGETLVGVGPGAAPHLASLFCLGCRVQRGWMPPPIVAFLQASIAIFGRPEEAITISSSVPTTYWGRAAYKMLNPNESTDDAAPSCLSDFNISATEDEYD